MGIVLTGIVAAVIIAVGAGIYLRGEQKEAWQVYSSDSTRVGNPGSNLVGQNWTGNPGAESAEAERSTPTT